jgi:hypothetical protein
MNCTISTPFLFEQTAAISFMQADIVCLKFFGFLVNVCMYPLLQEFRRWRDYQSQDTP